jgi:glycosyltransferase involved in cell wall biosynthesis
VRTPLVSIGLPVYNGGRFLKQALDSLLNQTLEDLELIVSDNASTDDTAAMCLDYAARDSRVRYIRQASNMRSLRNFNFVASRARGRYFKWASANDYCDRRLLEKCVTVLEADPGVVLCHGQACIVDEASQERRPYGRDVSATQARPSERFRSLVSVLEHMNPLCGVMRSEVLQRTPLMRPYVSGDLVLIVELALHGRMVLLPEILFYRRFGSATWSLNLNPADMYAFIRAGVGRRRFNRVRRHVDYFRVALATPMSVSERLRTLLFAAQHAGRDLPPAAFQFAKRSVRAKSGAPGAGYRSP